MKMLRGWLVLFTALAVMNPALAATKDRDLGIFGAWRAYAYEEGGQTVCYMVTTKMPPASSKKKTPSYIMVTHRPIEGSTDVFSYGARVDLDAKHGAQLTLGKENFDLFSVKNTAWAREALTDHRIAKALRGQSVAQIFALAANGRGVTVKEKFPLAGAAEAYRAINKACGLPPPYIAPVKKAPVIKKAAKKAAPKATAKANSRSTSSAKAAPAKKAAAPKVSSKPKVKTAVAPVKSGTTTTKKVRKTP